LEGRLLLSTAAPTPVLPPVTTQPPTTGGVIVAPPPTTQVTSVGLTIAAVAGATFSGDVGLLKGLSGTSLQLLTATINWGDSPAVPVAPVATNATGITTTSPAKLYFDAAGVLHVAGTHTYARAGTYPISISVIQNPPAGTAQPSRLYKISSSAVVGAKADAIVIKPTINQPFTGIVGKFNFNLPPATSTMKPTLLASINWGDGSAASAGTITKNTDGSYSVTGTHTYIALSTFHIAVTVYEQFLPVGPTPVPLTGTNAAQPVPVPSVVLLVAQISSTAIVQPGTVATNV
jgi:hypothetical protein